MHAVTRRRSPRPPRGPKLLRRSSVETLGYVYRLTHVIAAIMARSKPRDSFCAAIPTLIRYRHLLPLGIGWLKLGAPVRSGREVASTTPGQGCSEPLNSRFLLSMSGCEPGSIPNLVPDQVDPSQLQRLFHREQGRSGKSWPIFSQRRLALTRIFRYSGHLGTSRNFPSD